MLKAPIPYQGSKAKELDKIEKHQPNQFEKFIDAFGGGGSVMLYYAQRYDLEKVIYNDVDKCMTALFTVLSDDDAVDSLINEVKAITPTKETFLQLQAKADRTLAENIFIRKTAFKGMIATKLYNYKQTSMDSMLEKFKKYPPVMQKIDVSRIDAIKLIEQFKNDEDAFIYCDPPYLSKGVSNANYAEANIDTIFELSKILKDPNYKCKIMLHINFSGWLYANHKDQIKEIYSLNYNIEKRSVKTLNGVCHAIVTNY